MSDTTELPDIRFSPSDGLTYNPNEARYWDRAALAKEVERTFELCHSCRMCFKFCQSFPTLFDAVDAHGDVRRLPAATLDRVVDECFGCKLCYTQCPYTEAEGHEFRLDFPRLVIRARAVRGREQGIRLRERILGNPDLLGRVGTALPVIANAVNAFRPARVVLEKVAGIHRDKLLPRFESPTFEAWFRAHAGGREETARGTIPVVLFPTCFVTWNRPSLGRAAVAVLEHNDCKVACPRGLECCGMPALDGGDVDRARASARRVVSALAPWVDRGYAVAVPNPTCSLMIRQEYRDLLDDPSDPASREAAGRVAAATRDLSEFLFELRREGRFREDFRSTPGAVAYHAPCHLRMQNVGFRGRDLMRRIPGVKPQLVAECCGHDGTWAMKRESFELSLRNGRKAFEGMSETGAEVWTSDCPLAAVQFEQACGKTVLHPVEVLERAYRAEGWPARVPEPGEGA